MVYFELPKLRHFQTSLLAGMVLTLPLLTGCLDHPVKPVEVDKTSIDDVPLRIQNIRDVDILFVIDNSFSMAEEQKTLSNNFGSFLDVLEKRENGEGELIEDPTINYRIGITTTDAGGNPRCPAADTTPERGDLILSSCRDRIQSDFIRMTPDIDATFACEDVCNQDVHSTMEVLPTAIAEQTEAKPRNWIERTEGVSNISIPQNVLGSLDVSATTAAFQCFGPQGITGCGFESHLESMYFALTKSTVANEEENFGFLRDSALLSVIFITDEADCSHNPAQKSFFENNKNPLWGPLADNVPTSAACWFAGVTCEGGMGGDWDTCSSVNWSFNKDANPQSELLSDEEAAEKAILFPVKRYVDKINDIIAKKQENLPDEIKLEPLIAVIGGVPEDYPNGTVPLKDLYQDSPDLDFQAEFGIGPGCTVFDENDQPIATAIPPVRLREFAEAFNPENPNNSNAKNIYSICANDYSQALDAIANRIREQVRPACFPSCVADTDPTTEIVDANCRLNDINSKDGTVTDIPECEPGDVVPEGSDVCFVYLVDPAGNSPVTPETADDMDSECVDQGFNLEFRIVRKTTAPAGTRTEAACELSDLPVRDCPNLAL